MRLFSLDSPVFRFLTLLADLMILNVVYVITCIPVITIGAATCALYRTMLDRRYDRDAGVNAYFRFFKANFKQATPRYLLCLLIGIILVFDIRYSQSGQIPIAGFLIPLFIALFIVLLAVSSWVLALTGQFDNTAKSTFRNAAFFAIRHLPVSLLLLLRFLPALLALLSAELFLIVSIVFFLIYYALIAYLASGPLSRIFLSLMPPEEAAERAGEIREKKKTEEDS